jgi:hypothetical protein
VKVIAEQRLVGLAALLLLVPALEADPVTYSYNGMDFTQFSGSSYAGSDSVSGSITLSSPLPLSDSSMTDYSSEVTALSFSDGVQLIDTLNPGDTFELGTSNGQIIKWDLVILSGSTEDQINTQYSTYQGMDNFDEGASGSGDYGLISYDPGEWDVESAPEPAAILMTFFGVIPLAGAMLSWGKRQTYPN